MPKTQANARFLHEYLHDVIVDTHRVTDKNELTKLKWKCKNANVNSLRKLTMVLLQLKR